MTFRCTGTHLRHLRLLLLGALVMLNQTAVMGAEPSSDTSQVESAVPVATDEQVKQALVKMEALAQKEIDANAVVGIAIAVVHKGKQVYAKGFGLREVGKPAKVNADTVFQLASVSKPIGATVVAGLIGDGKISWDSKISDLDPSFEMYDSWVTRQLTLRDMYSHRSGLPKHAGDLLEDMGYDRAQVLHRLRYQQPDSSFRAGYAYTNFGMTEAAIAAAKACGMSWEQASAEKLYKPLGMNSTSSEYKDLEARENRALGHVLVDGKWVQKFNRQPDAQSPAGGVSSSVNDLSKWLNLRMSYGKYAGKQIIAEAPLVETEHPQMLTQFNPFNGLPGFYGLGININYDERGLLHLGHSGAFAMGAGTSISLVPKEQLAIVVLTNSAPVGVAEGLTQSFTDMALNGKAERDWMALFKKVFADPATIGITQGFDFSKPPVSKAQPLADKAYLGRYSNDLYGDISITKKDGSLVMTYGPKNIAAAMKHYDRDTFFYEPIGENADGPSGITFQVSPGGQATTVTVENLNEQGQGVFKRMADSE